MKKAVYICLTAVLMLLLSYIVHLCLLTLVFRVPVPVECYERLSLWTALCILPQLVRWSIAFIGIVAGVIVGQRWWKLIYVDHRSWKPKVFVRTAK